MPIPQQGRTAYKKGVTRNEKNKTWLARLMRNGVQHTEYFSDKKYETKELAYNKAVAWVEKLGEELGPRGFGAATEYAKTLKNKSGVPNVSLKKYIASNKKGQVYYNWWGKWREHRAGKSFSIMKYGDDMAFVLAYLAAYKKVADTEAVESLYWAMDEEEYFTILNRKEQSPPEDWLESVEDKIDYVEV